jgi:hypothetical protein
LREAKEARAAAKLVAHKQAQAAFDSADGEGLGLLPTDNFADILDYAFSVSRLPNKYKESEHAQCLEHCLDPPQPPGSGRGDSADDEERDEDEDAGPPPPPPDMISKERFADWYAEYVVAQADAVAAAKVEKERLAAEKVTKAKAWERQRKIDAGEHVSEEEDSDDEEEEEKKAKKKKKKAAGGDKSQAKGGKKGGKAK